MSAVIKTGASGVHLGMEIKKDDTVEVWAGAAVGSPCPPQPGDVWLEARVVEARGDRFQVAWAGTRPGMPWVARSAIRPCKNSQVVVQES